MKRNYVALGGLFACLHVLFLIVSKIIFGSELLLVLFLPLLSTIYTLKCDKKSITMFIIATLLICFVFDFVNTFIYVVPALICGITYGLLRKKQFRELEILCVSGFAHVISLAFSFFVIVLLFKEVDFLFVFEKIFSVSGENLLVITLLLLLVLGFCEALITHIITDSELSKFGYKVIKNECVPKCFLFFSIFSFLIFVIVYFFNNLYSVFPMLLFFVFFIPYIIEGFMNFKYKLLTVSLMILFAFFSIFIVRFVKPINYIFLPIFTISPIVINNFEDIKEKIF